MRLSPRRRTYGKHAHPTYNPAQRIVDKFGGEAQMAKALGIRRESVYKWSYASPYGRDGLVPQSMVERIQKAARLDGIILTEEDWAPTRVPEPEVETETE